MTFRRSLRSLSLALVLALRCGRCRARRPRPARPAPAPLTDEQKLLAGHAPHPSETLMGYVNELVSEKYGGRLTGTPEYNACAEWVVGCSRAGASSRRATTGPTIRFPQSLYARLQGRPADHGHPGQRTDVIKKSLQVRGRIPPRRDVGLGRGHGRSRLSSATASPRRSWATTITPGWTSRARSS